MSRWLIVLLLSGCASQTTIHVPVEPRPNTIQVTEIRPSWFSTHTVGVTFDSEGKIAGVTGSAGEPVITLPLTVLSVGATLGGAYLLGEGLKGAIPNRIDTSGDHTLGLDVPDIEIPDFSEVGR